MTPDQFIPLGLAYLMFTVGLEVKPGSFRALGGAPGVVLAGFASQMVLAPLLALGLALIFGLPAPYALGLVIVAASPSGVTSNFIVLMARGDTALSIVLTVLTSLCAVLTVPLTVQISGGLIGIDTAMFRIPILPTILAIAATTAAPLALALWWSKARPAEAARWQPVLRKLGMLIFAAILAIAVAAQWRLIVESWSSVGAAVIALNLGAMAAGLLVGALIAAGEPRCRTMLIQGGLRNIALALTVSVNLIGRHDLAVPATVYAFVMNLSALALILVLRRLRN